MTAILVQGNSEGTRRCDASCHNARESKCTCVCNGRYHGKRDRAQQSLRDDLESGKYGDGLAVMATTAMKSSKASPRMKELW
ncbi:MAG: hypothetical protein ACRDH8_15450 [Actinomycetota bacterium]